MSQQGRPFRGYTRSYGGLCSVPTTNLRRSGFTREYGGGGNGERRVEIGQQGRPLRG
ncbi:diguanylate phosphodiesterase [Pseudomonas putida]|nr:diguanylate phosphodiesterase [Pseudomonas putida]